MSREVKFISALFIAAIIGAWVLLQEVKKEVRQIDESGGLKALVERVWEGKQ